MSFSLVSIVSDESSQSSSIVYFYKKYILFFAGRKLHPPGIQIDTPAATVINLTEYRLLIGYFDLCPFGELLL